MDNLPLNPPPRLWDSRRPRFGVAAQSLKVQWLRMGLDGGQPRWRRGRSWVWGLAIAALGLGGVPQALAQGGTSAPGSPGGTAGAGVRLVRPDLNVGDRGTEVLELQAVLVLMGFYGGAVDGIYGETTRSAVAAFQQAAGLGPTGVMTAPTWDRLFPPGATLAGLGITGSIANGAPPNPTPSGVPTGSSVPAPPPTTAAAFPVPPAASNPPPGEASSAPGSSPSTPNPNTNRNPQGDDPGQANTAGTPEPETGKAPEAETPNQPQEVGVTVLRKGMRGSAVEALQSRLQDLDFYQGGVDGDFGEQTETAVKAFQSAEGLEPDGVVGGATWDVLLNKP